VSFWGIPKVVSAGSKTEGSCRFGAQGAMIRHLVGQKLPLARPAQAIYSRNFIWENTIASLNEKGGCREANWQIISE
jgi:hypothetical protein